MLAHLYRGEMYRCKVWRTRLDATTNWAVATTGIALSVAFSNAENSPLPLVDNGWNEALALNYERLHFHISFWEAMGRRLRRNYCVFLFSLFRRSAT